MIRKMTEDDLERVVDLESQSFSDPWSLNVYRDTLKIDGVIYLVYETEGDIVAAAGVRNIVGDGEITNVMTDRRYRGRGIAFALLEELIKAGRQIGVHDFTLEVRAGNRHAIKLYEKLGFVSEGVRPDFYSHPKEDALIMWMREASTQSD